MEIPICNDLYKKVRSHCDAKDIRFVDFVQDAIEELMCDIPVSVPAATHKKPRVKRGAIGWHEYVGQCSLDKYFERVFGNVF